jgi:hypothetical protein
VYLFLLFYLFHSRSCFNLYFKITDHVLKGRVIDRADKTKLFYELLLVQRILLKKKNVLIRKQNSSSSNIYVLDKSLNSIKSNSFFLVKVINLGPNS